VAVNQQALDHESNAVTTDWTYAAHKLSMGLYTVSQKHPILLL